MSGTHFAGRHPFALPGGTDIDFQSDNGSGAGTYLPFDRVQGIHAHIDEDGALAHIAQRLECADGGHSTEAVDIVQRVVTDGDRAAEESDNAAEVHGLAAQVGQVAQQSQQSDFL